MVTMQANGHANSADGGAPRAPRAPRVLVIGYGNPGRLDDGLGIACAERLEAENLPNVTVDADYQLTVEDAETIARHDVAIFVDAVVSGPDPFTFERVAADDEVGVSYTSHHLEPGAVMALARDLFQADVPAFALAIRGHDFDEFGEALSDQAISNLEAATRFLTRTLRDGHLAALVSDPAADAGPSASATERPAKP
jgi:hydrogenase maturation protease